MLESMGSMNFSNVALTIINLLILFFSIILHEISHGLAALAVGDDTAKRAGRLSLNPIRHIDLFGTIILPILLLVGSGGRFSFGFAKPVPINPRNFRNERSGLLITGIAGPLTNIGLAVVGAIAFWVMIFAAVPPESLLYQAAVYMVMINLILAFFNLIPIPPLDGSRVIQRFLPESARDAYHRLEPYGFLIIIAITWIFPSILNWYFQLTVYPIATLMLFLNY